MRTFASARNSILLPLPILLLLTASAGAQSAAPAGPPLTVTSAGPTGEIATLAEANEIRMTFSEPMVTLGRVPARVTAPYVTITPAIAGAFRWSGTRLLIFTPDPKRPLPYATKYDVVVDRTAKAVSGRTLAQPYRFSFTTPTVRLLQTHWYRRGGRAGAPMVVLLRFNQPVSPPAVMPHLAMRFQPHAWREPPQPGGDAAAIQAFIRRRNATRAVAASEALIEFRPTADWDKKRFPPSRDLIILETLTAVPPDAWVRVVTGERMPSPAGPATPGRADGFTIETEPAFFVDGFHCSAKCDPDRWNPIRLRTVVSAAAFAKAVRVADVTDASSPRSVERSENPQPREDARDQDSELTLEDAGFQAQPPARTYSITIDGSLQSADGQALGYTWSEPVENWHARAFTSFGDGHGVWETGGGKQLPFYARNFRSVKQWAYTLSPPDLMPTIVALQTSRDGVPPFSEAPPSEGAARRLSVTPDRIQSHGLDLSKHLSSRGTGIVWTAVEDGEPIERSRTYRDEGPTIRASLVQVTNLGITVKDSPLNTLIFITSLDTGAPVSGARVSIIRPDNSTFWSGTTALNGVAIAPKTPLRSAGGWYQFAFIVTAEKDGDLAYVGSNWNEGILPWEFGVPFNLTEAEPYLRGSVFSDRGVYRLGEEVHLKAILRHNTPEGVRMLSAGTAVAISMRDSQNRVVDERTVKVNGWSSVEWTVTLPAEGSLGNYSVGALLESDKPSPRKPENLRPFETPGPDADNYVPYYKTVQGSFLVAAYRRPDFRVDVSLSAATPLAGDAIKGTIAAKYLFGAPMGARPVTWTWTMSRMFDAPAAVRERFPTERWLFVGWDESVGSTTGQLASDTGTLTKTGELPLDLTTKLDAGVPYSYVLEGDVEDVSRQHIANRTNIVVHPAPWYVGLRLWPYFVQQKDGLNTEVVTVTPTGQTVPNVPVEITLTQIQWNSVRRAEGNGFYTWDTERKEVKIGTWTVTTASVPVPLNVPLPSGGEFVITAIARESSGRYAVTSTSFYVLGQGYTAWARYDHNRIDLVPEKKTYKPGDTARIMIQSPWERATALVTTEREGIRSHRQFPLTSTQQSIEIPITEDDIPNVFVSVLLVRGRTATNAPEPAAEAKGGPYAIEDPSDPGKPSFRLGYVELKVEDRMKRLTVAVKANREEYRPANAANVTLKVTDHLGRGAPSEVTLWAVDYGVLSLTNYRAPDVLSSVYMHKALQVLNEDSRQRIISRRVLTPKGETEGGGGGAEAGTGDMRKDFRALAFWLGSVITGADGEASVDVKLPESLTTYRIMAVAGDRRSRFGGGDTEVRVNKPLTMKPTFPRFLAVGDTARFGAVVTSQLKTPGDATVTIKSLDPGILEFTGPVQQTIALAAGGAGEARFEASGKAIGRARLQMTVKLGDESDAFEDVIPVEVLASPETVAAYGQTSEATAIATEKLTVPAGVVPTFGGLHVELSSTAMVGLGEGARYLVEYPYGCAEQRGSRALALLLAADLGDAFTLPGIDTSKMRPAAQQTMRELEKYQCGNGGFAYWPGGCAANSTSPYLTAYLLHVFKVASDLKYQVSDMMVARALNYLEQVLALPPPQNESWWPAYTAWQAFAVKVLVEHGRNQDSNINRIYGYRDRMPVFALAYMHDALLAKGEASGVRVDDLRRRIANAILQEAGSAHVEELADPYLLWFWNSNVRSTAIALGSLVRAGMDPAQIRPMVRWMMSVRNDGRWGNTQENAWAMEALVAYYRKYEAAIPDFSAVVRLGAEELTHQTFKGRSTESAVKTIPMADILTKGAPGSSRPLTFTREGTGTLFYTARLRYAADESFQDGLDAGFNIERTYAPYVENGTRPTATTYQAGDLVRVTLTFRLTKERRYVAVTDPLPAGFEPVESWFATTAAALGRSQDDQGEAETDWTAWWRRGGFDHVERHDDRVQLFATRLSEGRHEFSYIVRATTAGVFRTAPARAEEMYEPEVFGRTATAVITVR